MWTKGTKRKHADEEEAEDRKKEEGFYIAKFAQERSKEIQALQECLQQPGSNRLVFQTLPRHMRRRAMGHNIKRLPRSMRDGAQKEYEARMSKSKVPRRKFRRRPKNLLEEYTRRQRKNVWLETHIWHAKRFKMADKWNYRVPIQPTEKGYRAAYRATVNHCLIQDISFMCCIEIKGQQEQILEGLSHLTSKDAGLTFAAKGSLYGSREGSVVLYSSDKFPYNAIGPVAFLWKPLLGDSEKEDRTLWVWVHPSCYEECWEEIIKALKLTNGLCTFVADSKEHCIDTREDNTQEKVVKSVNDDLKNTSKCQEKHEHVQSQQPLENRRCEINGILVESLKDNLVRFRLTGPLAHTVLTQALDSADVMPKDADVNKWWNKYYSLDSNSIALTQQREFWSGVKKCKSTAELHPHMVLGLTVRDPRYTLPHIVKKVRENLTDVDADMSFCTDTLPPDLCLSALWDAEVRTAVKSSKPSDHTINTIKAENLVPGLPLQSSDDESRVPVLLIQNPGRQSKHGTGTQPPSNYGSGWDIILPGGWSMAFWVAFNYCGARAGGLRDSETISMDQGVLRCPTDYIDTKAGKREEAEEADKLGEIYSKKPPSKRHNFIKLGVKYPFYCPWSELVREWVERKVQDDVDAIEKKDEIPSQQETQEKEPLKSQQQPYVLRHIQDLKLLSKIVSVVPRLKIVKGKVVQEECDSLCSKYSNSNCQLQELSNSHASSLIQVTISVVNKGAPEQFAMICIPNEDDIKNLCENLSYGGPVEDWHKDLTKKTKKEKKKFKKLKLADDPPLSDVISSCNGNILSCNNREVIGYVKQGGFTNSVGNGTGLGFCSMIGFLKLLDATTVNMPCLVIIRNPSSYQYRFAYIQVSV